MNHEAEQPKNAVVNTEEFIGKTVGRRRTGDPARIQRIGRAIYRSAGFRVCDPGVYRFKSHEEANQWMLQMAVKRALQAAKS